VYVSSNYVSIYLIYDRAICAMCREPSPTQGDSGKHACRRILAARQLDLGQLVIVDEHDDHIIG
jgi:hypothetical protein